MQKSLIIIICLLFFCSYGFAKANKQCEAILLSVSTCDQVQCGVVSVTEEMKFGVYRNGNRSKVDTIIFYVICPSLYGEHFWVVNDVYQISYDSEISVTYGSNTINNWNLSHKKYRVMGEVADAKKLKK